MEIVLLPRLKSVLTLCSLVSFEHGGSVSDTFLYGLKVLKMWSSWMFPENLWLDKDNRLKLVPQQREMLVKRSPYLFV